MQSNPRLTKVIQDSLTNTCERFLNGTTHNISFKQFVQRWLICKNFKIFDKNTKTQYLQHKNQKFDTYVSTPPNLNSTLSSMLKTWRTWTRNSWFGNMSTKHSNTYIQLNTHSNNKITKIPCEDASQNRGKHFNKTVNFWNSNNVYFSMHIFKNTP